MLSFASPLTDILTVLRHRSTKSLPLTLIAAYALCSLEWLLYGIWIEPDPIIVLPNGIGLVLEMVQLGLFLVYPQREEWEGKGYGKEVVHRRDEVEERVRLIIG